jgi:hypothetical protein
LYASIIIGIASSVAAAFGTEQLNEKNYGLGVLLIGIGIVGLFAAYALYSSRVKFPGAGA